LLYQRAILKSTDETGINMNQEGRVSTEQQGHILLIGLDRVAKRNAFDRAMLNALALAYAELERNDQLRCGVLFAHGDHFTGGLELTQVSMVS
jgi:enoyl-CoA hydratase/carnithine racemase